MSASCWARPTTPLSHLASDPERVLEIAVDYINFGVYQDTLELLSRNYPAHDPQESEPGAPLPQDYALTPYYRGYCQEKLGRSPDQEYRAASALSTRYLFPYRPTDLIFARGSSGANPTERSPITISATSICRPG